MRTVHFLIPGDPSTVTGGYVYDRRISETLRAHDWTVVHHRLGGGFPRPTQRERDRAASTLHSLASGALVLIDGLALGAMPDEVRACAGRLRLVALVHHPLTLETGLSSREQAALEAQESLALQRVRRVIVTSRRTARDVERLGVAGECIGVVEPGTDRVASARVAPHTETSLLCVAAITPRKGHAILIEALGRVADLQWHLHCAGSLQRSPSTAAALQAQIERLRLSRRVTLYAECAAERLAHLYRGAELFVLPSYHEGYGMALAEALAHGVPVVSTRAGAIPDTVPAEAGLLVAPGDVAALARVLRKTLCDDALRARLAAGARRAATRLPTWDAAGRLFSAELQRANEM